MRIGNNGRQLDCLGNVSVAILLQQPQRAVRCNRGYIDFKATFGVGPEAVQHLATGTIRRHPDLPHAKDGAEFGALIALQAAMLDHAVSLLKPGGRLVYCTCSLLPDEGEVQVEEALTRHETLEIDAQALALPGVDPAWITEEGGLRLCPDFWADAGGMDGFYIAALRRE